jgi:hypothetical protein
VLFRSSCSSREKKYKYSAGNPAEVYNTVYKIAYKRAFVGAVIISSGITDIFNQDLEDIVDVNQDQERVNEVLSLANQVKDKLNESQRKYFDALYYANKYPEDQYKRDKGNLQKIIGEAIK